MISPPAAALAQAAGATVSPVQNVDDAEGATGEVIVVTARKREAAALDVPMSISVLSGDRLEKLGVRNLRDGGSLFPGWSFNERNGSGGEFSIRGVHFVGPGRDTRIGH